jgi:hypothetical protein
MPEVKNCWIFAQVQVFILALEGKKIQMFRCYINVDYKLFNDHIIFRVLLRPLKCIAILLRGSVENPWVRYSLNKMAGK